MSESRLDSGANTSDRFRRALQRSRTAPVMAQQLVDLFPHLFGLDATETLYVKLPIVATADLPAAAANENGRVLIEDAGAGNRNLIIYAGGERFRIDGGAAF